MDEDQIYKDDPIVHYSNNSEKQEYDVLGDMLDKLNKIIEAAAFSQSYDDWNNVLKFLDKINSKFILLSDIDDGEMQRRISAFYNDNTCEKLIIAARNGFPNLDNFLQNKIIQIISIFTDFAPYPHLLLFRYNIMDDLIKILYDPSSKVVFICILNIISKCVKKTSEYRKTGLFSEDNESINEYYYKLLRSILDICWTKDENNCYQIIQSDLMETANELIKISTFDIEHAAETYDRFSSIIKSQNESEKAYMKSVLIAFHSFLKKEVSFYNNFMADGLYKIIVQLLDDANIKCILKLLEPILDVTEFADKLAETQFIETVCDLIQTPPKGNISLPVYFAYALRMIAKATYSSELVAHKVVEIRLTSRPQLYSQDSLPGNIHQESKRSLLLLFNGLLHHGIGPSTEQEFAYLPTFLENTIQFDDHEVLGCTLNLINFIIHHYTDFSIDIEDRLHDILEDEDLQEFYPVVEEIGSILFPENE